MDKKERFFATIAREKTDKPAWWLGLPTNSALPALNKHFNAKHFSELKSALNDDVWAFDLPYKNGSTNAISMAFDFAKQNDNSSYEHRTLTSAGFFEDCEEESDFERYDKWPNPADFIFKEDCIAAVKSAPDNYPKLGILWSAHFQDACAAFGMQDALVKMKIAPQLFKRVIDRIVEFYLKANEIFYEYTLGSLDAVLIGNDFGTQQGLMVGRQDLKDFVFDGTKRLIAQAHSYNLKVIHHSCGAINDIIPDLIDCGADVIHPIQALAKDMEANKLKSRYGDKVSFAGGIDAQHLLVSGSPSQIKEKVLELRAIFPTGLIISPSHEAILPDVPPQNIRAIAEAMKN